MSGINIDNRMIRKGSVDAIAAMLRLTAVTSLPMLIKKSSGCASGSHAAGGGGRFSCAGVIALKDIVKGGIKERFAQLLKWALKR